MENWSFVTEARVTDAIDKPKSRNNPRNPVKAMTMPNSPKSCGNSSLAMMTMEPVRSMNDKPWAAPEASAPRMVLPFRSRIS